MQCGHGLSRLGFKATSFARDDADAKAAIRERLELTQEQFALHYGLELDAAPLTRRRTMIRLAWKPCFGALGLWPTDTRLNNAQQLC
jgi:hypothetical protein